MGGLKRGLSVAVAMMLCGVGALEGAAQEASPHVEAAQPMNDRVLVFSTGTPSGLYFPAGTSICAQINAVTRTIMAEEKKADAVNSDIKLLCAVRNSEGSLDNLRRLDRGQIDLALVQSDDALNAYNGSTFRVPDTSLRLLFELHSEAVTVIARANGPKTIHELVGKKVALAKSTAPLTSMIIGGTLSAEREACKDRGRCWRLGAREGEANACTPCDEESGYSFVPVDKARRALCEGGYDAVAFVVGHPASRVQKIVDQCDVRFLGADFGQGETAFKAASPSFSDAVFLPSIYAKPGGRGSWALRRAPELHTLGVAATVVASENLDPGVVYHFVKTVFERLDALKTNNAVVKKAFGGLTRERMARTLDVIPLHEGARRYFEEQNWFKDEEAAAQKPEA